MQLKANKKSDTLFVNNYPEDCDNETIKKFQDKNPNQDPYYIATACIKERKERVDKLWDIFKPYASKHFLSEYKKKGNFHSRTWEMYLTSVFIKNKYNISVSKKDNWPDIKLDNNICIECVTPNNANNPNKSDYVPAIKFGKVRDVPTEQIKMRLTSSIHSKIEDYKRKKNYKKQPFIIAINSANLGNHQNPGYPIIFSILWGYDDFCLHLERIGTQVISKGVELQTKSQILKNNDPQKPIDVAIFETDKYAEISGVIFSNNSVFNYPDILGLDCMYIPNPYAKFPVDYDCFPFFVRADDIKSKIKPLII
jgi:hypothetical protein